MRSSSNHRLALFFTAFCFPLVLLQVAAAQAPSSESSPKHAGGLSSVPLPKPTKDIRSSGGAARGAGSVSERNSSTKSSPNALLGTLLPLGVVLGLFLGVAAVFRKYQPQESLAVIPTEVLEIIGRKRVSAQKNLLLLRFGGRILLVHEQLGETKTISEITEPSEVEIGRAHV